MIWLGLGAVAVGMLMIGQEFSDTLDAIVPDVVTGVLGGAVVTLAGVILVVKAVM